MQRVNSVSDVTRLSVPQDSEVFRAFEVLQGWFESVEQKENPAEATAGLNEADKTGIQEITGEAFYAAFRGFVQARDVIRDLCAAWDEFDKGRAENEIEPWERSCFARYVGAAEIIYRECYRGEILRDFEEMFGRTYETFEVSLAEIKRILGGAQ